MKIKNIKKYKKTLIILAIIILFPIIASTHNFYKSLPEGISYEGTIYNVAEEDVDILFDLNYKTENNSKIIEQEIFQNVFELVDNAEKFILIDMFLFNNDYSDKVKLIPLTTELKDRLIKKKQENPDIKITFITDEINNFYGSYTSAHIKELEDNNINVIITDLSKLKDINIVWSGFWRAYIQWFGTSGNGWIKHPLGNSEYKVTLRSWFKLFNVKANHRKIIIADSGDEIHSIITSANPHDASSHHSNIGILIKSKIWKDILETEESVAKFSNSFIDIPDFDFLKEKQGNIQVQLLTEGKIEKSLLNEIKNTKKGEKIDIAMFYLSDRDIIKSLIEASNKGVEIRLILDPNKDAFAREKNGIPNRQVAYELVKKSSGKIKIKWYNTFGAQFHTKIIIIRKADKIIIFLGSANLTRRNINDFNLETNVKLITPSDTELSNEIIQYYTRIWNNENGIYTLDFEEYKDTSLIKHYLYRFQEYSGFSTF